MNNNLSRKLHKKRRITAIGLTIVYYFTILVCYHYVVSPLYSYAGLHFRMLPGWIWGISLFLSLLPVCWLPLDFIRPSDFAAWILFLCLILPANVISFMVSSEPLAKTMALPFALTASFCIFEFVRKRTRFRIPPIKGQKVLFDTVVPVFTVVMSIVVLSYTNFQVHLSLENVYDRRLLARDLLLPGSAITYLIAFLESVCLPIVIVYAVEQKKWYYISVAIFAVVAIFSFFGSKATVFRSFMLIGVIFLMMRTRVNIGIHMIRAVLFLVLLACIEYAWSGTATIATLLIRRELMVPAQLTTYYWEFFTHNPFAYMKDSSVGLLIPTAANYSIPTSRIIGFEYFGSIENNANANIWAASFADFGYIGMIATSVLAALLLAVIDSMASHRKTVLGCVCCTALGLTWVNGALYTSILTNGGLGLILMLWIYPAEPMALHQVQGRKTVGYVQDG